MGLIHTCLEVGAALPLRREPVGDRPIAFRRQQGGLLHKGSSFSPSAPEEPPWRQVLSKTALWNVMICFVICFGLIMPSFLLLVRTLARDGHYDGAALCQSCFVPDRTRGIHVFF